MFELEAVSVLELERVIVGHDGHEAGQGWFLDKVVVKEAEEVDREFVFLCGRWLDAGEDDQAIERELLVSHPQPQGR